MSRRIKTIFVGLSVLVASSCGADGDTPGFIFLPGMVESVPYDAYDAHPIIGQAARMPPAGTVPFGATVFGYGPGEQEAKRAGAELVNPVPSVKVELDRGKVVFDRFCVVCHGPAGDGDGPIIGRFPNPPSLKGQNTRSLPDGQLFHVMTRGQGIMVSYAMQVNATDRWRMVHYIRHLQGTWVDATPRVATTVTATKAEQVELGSAGTSSTATTTHGGSHE